MRLNGMHLESFPEKYRKKQTPCADEHIRVGLSSDEVHVPQLDEIQHRQPTIVDETPRTSCLNEHSFIDKSNLAVAKVKECIYRSKEKTVLAAQEQGRYTQPAVTENIPKKISLDQRDYKHTLPLPAKKKNRNTFPHLSCGQIANLTLEF